VGPSPQMGCPQVVDGGGNLQIWRVAVDRWIADKGLSSNLRGG